MSACCRYKKNPEGCKRTHHFLLSFESVFRCLSSDTVAGEVCLPFSDLRFSGTQVAINRVGLILSLLGASTRAVPWPPPTLLWFQLLAHVFVALCGHVLIDDLVSRTTVVVQFSRVCMSWS